MGSSTEYRSIREVKVLLVFYVSSKALLMRIIPLTVEKRAGHDDKNEVARYPPKPNPIILSVSFLPITLS